MIQIEDICHQSVPNLPGMWLLKWLLLKLWVSCIILRIDKLSKLPLFTFNITDEVYIHVVCLNKLTNKINELYTLCQKHHFFIFYFRLILPRLFQSLRPCLVQLLKSWNSKNAWIRHCLSERFVLIVMCAEWTILNLQSAWNEQHLSV